jgi:hypothetical protein
MNMPSPHLRLFYEWPHGPTASVVNDLGRKRFAMNHQIAIDRALGSVLTRIVSAE